MRLYEVVSAFDTATPWYHGSKVNGFWEFDRAFLRSGIVNTNSSGGFYFSSERDAADYFADAETVVKDSDGVWNYDDIRVYGGEGENYLLIGYGEEDAAATESEWIKGSAFDRRRTEINRGPYNTPEAAYAAGRVIIDQFNAAEMGETFYHEDKVIAVYLALGNSLEINGGIDHFRQAECTAREKGYDSVVARDIYDGGLSSDVAVVFDPKRIRII